MLNLPGRPQTEYKHGNKTRFKYPGKTKAENRKKRTRVYNLYSLVQNFRVEPDNDGFRKVFLHFQVIHVWLSLKVNLSSFSPKRSVRSDLGITTSLCCCWSISLCESWIQYLKIYIILYIYSCVSTTLWYIYIHFIQTQEFEEEKKFERGSMYYVIKLPAMNISNE